MSTGAGDLHKIWS